MPYKYVDKTSHTQEEMTYILYRAIGNCFKRTICLNKLQETKLLLYYLEMTDREKSNLSSRISDEVSRALHSHEDIFKELVCEANISKIGNSYILTFETGLDSIRASVTPIYVTKIGPDGKEVTRRKYDIKMSVTYIV